MDKLESLTPEQIAAGLKVGAQKGLVYAKKGWKKAVVVAQDIDEKLDKYKARKLDEADAKKQAREEWWADLTDAQREVLRTERTKTRLLNEELRQKRSQYDQYAADRTIASLQGARWNPKVYKVSTGSGMFGEESYKYVDEYGREVPEPAGEVFQKRSRSPKRTETGDLENLLGASYSGGRSPSRRREYMPPESDMMEGSGRHRDRSSAPSQQRSRRSERDDVYDLFR
jgi:hypothetical protein